MELVPLLCLLSLWVGCVTAQETRTVNVPEGDDALLPCILNSGQIIDKFDWRKDDGEQEKQEVFTYESGSHFGNGRKGQSEQFKNRVVFFQNELKSGNASIIIKNTRLEDNGTYTCGLIELHRPVHIRLNVDPVLKIRNVNGAARKPNIETIRDEIIWRILICSVTGKPNPEVEWRNSAGKELIKYVPESEDGNSHVELLLKVTTSDNYTCVATQRSIHHQINSTFPVSIPDVVAVPEGEDAVLPCFLNSKHHINSMVFNWRKGDKEVFCYNRGQVEEDTGRLTYFKQELEFGNISIKIHNTQKSDSGHYTCNFLTIQKAHVILQVVETSNILTIICALLGTLLVLACLAIVYLILKARRNKSKKDIKSKPSESEVIQFNTG